MNNEKYNQIIDEAYENYINKEHLSLSFNFLYKEEFINKCKTDNDFSEKWGLKIEERGLTFEEKFEHVRKLMTPTTSETEQIRIALSIPTKITTVTYKNEKTEVYE